MNTKILLDILFIISVFSTGIVFGTDFFFALVVKKAAKLSQDRTLADIFGRIHWIADKRMPPIGITSILSSALYGFFSGGRGGANLSAFIAVICLLSHLALYIRFSKPINTEMTNAILENKELPNIRDLQNKWDSLISLRAGILSLAMLFLLISIIIR
jgi:hypothetical protein